MKTDRNIETLTSEEHDDYKCYDNDRCDEDKTGSSTNYDVEVSPVVCRGRCCVHQ